jgi:hypothetical protein
MKSVLHLMRKDLSYFWPLLLLSTALAIATLWCDVHFYGSFDPSTPAPAATFLIDLILPVARWVLLFVIPVVVIQEDLVLGDRAVWLTRPIQPRSLLAAKLLFLLVGLALPMAIIGASAAWYLGASAGEIAASARIPLEVAMCSSLFAVLLAACTKTLFRATVLLLGIFASAVLLTYFVSGRRPLIHFTPRFWPWPSPFHISDATNEIIGSVVLVVGILGALSGLYRWRRIFRAGACGILLFWVGCVLSLYWPIELIKFRPDSSVPALPPPRLLMRAASPKFMAEGGSKGMVQLNFSLHVGGMPANRPAEISFSSGKIVRSDGLAVSLGIAVEKERRLTPAALKSAFGLVPDFLGEQVTATTSYLTAKEFEELRGQTVQLDGAVVLTPIQYHLVQRFPLALGERYRERGEEWQVERLWQDASGQWLLTANFAQSARPWSKPGLEAKDIEIALVNPTRNEIALGSTDAGAINMHNHFLQGIDVGQITRSFTERRSRIDGESHYGIDADWLQHAEIYVLNGTRGRAVRMPFTCGGLALPAAADPASSAVFQTNSSVTTVESP